MKDLMKMKLIWLISKTCTIKTDLQKKMQFSKKKKDIRFIFLKSN